MAEKRKELPKISLVKRKRIAKEVAYSVSFNVKRTSTKRLRSEKELNELLSTAFDAVATPN